MHDPLTGLVWQRTFLTTAGISPSEAIAHCEALEYAGASDWRLPTYPELETLVDYGTFEPTIDPGPFPGVPNDWFATATALPGTSGAVWALNFCNGALQLGGASHVRCVRGHRAMPELPDGRFATTADETVVDHATRLTWHVPSAADMTWKDALATCERSSHAGRTDWRVPTITELATLVDTTIWRPATKFPGLPGDMIWTSTTYFGSPEQAWMANFVDGSTRYDFKTLKQHAVCVRGRQ